MPSHAQSPFSSSAGATYLDRDRVLDALRRAAIDAARRDPRIERIILFGSVASGRATPASDADLIVVLREGEPRRMDRIPRLLQLLKDSPLPLDIHPYTVAEWAQARESGDALAALAASAGVELVVKS